MDFCCSLDLSGRRVHATGALRVIHGGSELVRAVRTVVLSIGSFTALQPSGASAQAPSARPPEFEVASVKPSTTGELGSVFTYPGGRVELRGCTLEYLIEIAFDVPAFQVAGGPAWMQSDRYDIVAKPPASSESSRLMPRLRKTPLNLEQRQMLQSLLAERFHLKWRRERRESSVYLLERTKHRLKLKPAKDTNEYPWAGGLSGGMITGDGLAGVNESMPDLARRLSPYLGRPVLDRTGLPGSFDFRSEYPQDQARPDVIAVIFSTLDDLGLKLKVSRGQVERIVVEYAARVPPD